jgi:Putative Tad-like Flp pilus-assembly
MKENNPFFPRGADRNRRGQALIFVTMSTTVIFGLTGLVYDFAVMDHDQSLLNASTQAAALAGAEAMAQAGATVTTTTAAVTSFSSQTGDVNASGFISGASLVSGYPVLSCLTTLQTGFGIYCYGPSSSNAIVVKQQVTVPLYFLRIFGTSSVILTSTATAAMKGATAGPFNVVIIVDTTHSMTSEDSDSNCSNTRIYCALSGIQTLLKSLSPCIYTQASCGTVTGGNVANSVDRVSLLTFPPVVATTAVDDYNCGRTAPTTVGYTTPFPATSTYQIVGFSSDYRTSDTATKLNTSSDLVAAVGATAGTGCIQVLGHFGTYYAQVIYAAQAYLVAEQKSFPNSQNVMILLSDGDATATCTTSSRGVCTAGDMVGANTSTTTYPSTLQECHQAVAAAAAAAKAGTRVYAVAYGAEASGCGSDTSPTITPCQTMQQIASSPGYFFSDYTATGASSSCISDSQPVTNLSQIFQVIAGDLTVAKLIPNGTT